MNRFTGKKIVITGGSSGIGFYTAKQIVNEGGTVLISGTNVKKLATAAKSNPNIHTLVNDASDLEAANNLAAESKRLFGEIDGVFLNAGIGGGAPLGDITQEMYHTVMNLNVGGVIFGMQALSPLLRNGGSVLLTASAAGKKAFVGGAIYSASKAAVISLARTFAQELVTRNIRVNSISPGPITTSFFDRMGRTPEQTKQLEGFIKSSNPMGRFGTVEEACAVTTFLLSDQSSFVTGSDYAVDGGEAEL